ncbi:MAG: CHASE3 domain-containing protein [Rhodobacteraceae bacterium]|nr:CHASE3 domain-containing protein [Paracoccaceae bacterium]
MKFQWFEDSSIKSKILVVMAVPVTLIAVVGVIGIAALQFVSFNVRWVDHTHNALAKGDAIVGAAVDMETGMRGFLLAGRDEFLEPYNEGQTRIFDGLAELRETVSDNPGQVARLEEAETVIRNWQSEVAEKQIALRREIGDASTMNDVARIVGEARGKTYFDRFRGQIATFEDRERALLEARNQDYRETLNSGALDTSRARDAMEWVTHTYSVIAMAETLLASAIDMETGMRGFLLAGRPEFLEPYEAGGAAFDTLRADLANTVDDNPAQVALLSEIQTTIDDWRREVVQPMIALRTEIGDAKTMDDMADLIGQARGKIYFDQFRAHMADFRAEEAELLVIRSEALSSAKTAAVTSILAFLALALCASVILAQKAGASIANPIGRIITAMEDIIDGKQDVEISGQDRKDEVGKMAQATQVFQENAQKVVTLAEAEAQNARKLEESAKRTAEEAAATAEQEKRDRAEALKRQRMVETLQEQIKSVVTAALEGDFSQRVDADLEDRELAAVADNVNTLLESVDSGVAATGAALERVAHGDLSRPMSGDFKGAFKDLQANTNEMIDALKSLIGDITVSTSNLASSSHELRDTSDALSKQAEQNAASLEETSAALDEMTANIKKVSENVTDANQNASVASETARASSMVAADAADAMSRISDASKEIAKVVTVINDIAFQINLLALNAGVEAARAGDAGRGFSVVASEVRQLAQRASEAASEIDDVIARSDQAVTEGVAKVTNARTSLEKISDSVVGVSSRIEQISNAVSEQVSGIDEINGSVARIDRNTQKQAASFEEVTAASSLLSTEADGLKRSAARFHTDAALTAPSSDPVVPPDVTLGVA